MSRTTAAKPRIAARSPYTRPRVTVTIGLVVLSRTVPTTRSMVSARSAAQFGSVNGFPGMGDDTTGPRGTHRMTSAVGQEHDVAVIEGQRTDGVVIDGDDDDRML